jgi:hypothetical protein
MFCCYVFVISSRFRKVYWVIFRFIFEKSGIFFWSNFIVLISGFIRDVDEICGLLGNYTASCGNYLPTFRDNVSVPSSRVKLGILTREDGTHTLSRNVGK